MRLAVIRSMGLMLLRDRAALAMAFILPPVFFAVFAMIFANTASGSLTVRTAIAAPDIPAATRTVGLLSRVETMEIVFTDSDPAAIRAAVQDDDADVGLVITETDDGGLAYEIISDPSREIAARLLQGAVMLVSGGSVPSADITVTPLSTSGGGAASYYAIAVTMLFLFLSALQGALSLIEAQESGIFDRLAVSPGGTTVIVDGSFIFLTLQGLAQGAAIFLIAWLVFGVPVPGNLGVILPLVLCAAVCAAGLCLAVVSLCKSRRQAHALGTILILMMSAIGGAMAPRILMPDLIQKIGLVTPSAWGIEAYSQAVIRGGPFDDILPWCAALLAAGLAGALVARVMAARY